MLFRQEFLALIKARKVQVAYRRWRRPSVKPGGTLLTPVGLLAIESVERVAASAITSAAAKAAGYPSSDDLWDELDARPGGELYRIQFSLAGKDPRLALREKSKLKRDEMAELLAKLARWSWAGPVMDLLASHPGLPSRELAPRMGWETLKFKTHVRKLKALGLTISLGTGYKLSPRGKSVHRRMKA